MLYDLLIIFPTHFQSYSSSGSISKSCNVFPKFCNLILFVKLNFAFTNVNFENRRREVILLLLPKHNCANNFALQNCYYQILHREILSIKLKIQKHENATKNYIGDCFYYAACILSIFKTISFKIGFENRNYDHHR